MCTFYHLANSDYKLFSSWIVTKNALRKPGLIRLSGVPFWEGNFDGLWSQANEATGFRFALIIIQTPESDHADILTRLYIHVVVCVDNITT